MQRLTKTMHSAQVRLNDHRHRGGQQRAMLKPRSREFANFSIDFARPRRRASSRQKPDLDANSAAAEATTPSRLAARLQQLAGSPRNPFSKSAGKPDSVHDITHRRMCTHVQVKSTLIERYCNGTSRPCHATEVETDGADSWAEAWAEIRHLSRPFETQPNRAG